MTLLILLAIAILAFITFTMVVVGLFEASWVVLLAILLVGLASIQVISMQRFSRPFRIADSGSAESATAMKPSQASDPSANPTPDHVYRGVHYQHDSVNPAADAVMHGLYRGQPWQHSNTAQPNAAPAPTITYRGIRVTAQTQGSVDKPEQQENT